MNLRNVLKSSAYWSIYWEGPKKQEQEPNLTGNISLMLHTKRQLVVFKPSILLSKKQYMAAMCCYKLLFLTSFLLVSIRVISPFDSFSQYNTQSDLLEPTICIELAENYSFFGLNHFWSTLGRGYVKIVASKWSDSNSEGSGNLSQGDLPESTISIELDVKCSFCELSQCLIHSG